MCIIPSQMHNILMNAVVDFILLRNPTPYKFLDLCLFLIENLKRIPIVWASWPPNNTLV